ncbi:putative major facilitator superfamily, MFS transporter superfamily [Plasmopara halstedii]
MIMAAEDKSRQTNRYFYVAFAVFQCFLGAGVIFGWTSLLPMLEKEKIYFELCIYEETICTAQSNRLQYAFTMAVFSSMWSNLLLGLVLDKFGPRVTKSISLVFLIAGALLMGNAHYRDNAKDNDLLLYGMVLVGFSGPGIQLSGIHMSNLFPESTALVACLIVGGLQLSFLIFALISFAYMHLGMSMATIFEIYATVLLLSLVGTLLTEPDTPLEVVSCNTHIVLSPMGLPSVFKDEETSLLLSTPELQKNHQQNDKIFTDGDLHNRSFRTQVLSKPFLLIAFYFSILSLWCNFFLGSINGLLRWKGLLDGEVNDLLGKLAFVLPGSVIFIPFVGYLLEKCGHQYSLLLCTLAALCTTILLSSMSTGWIVAGFVTYAFFRTFMYPLLFSYLGYRFGFQHYGALSGIAFGVGGIIGLLQTPIAAIGDFRTIGWMQYRTSSGIVTDKYCISEAMSNSTSVPLNFKTGAVAG